MLPKRATPQKSAWGEGSPALPCHTTRHAGPHRAVQRVTHRQRTSEVEQANRSTRWEARKTGPDCSPDAKGRVGCPLFAQLGPDRSRDDATARTVAYRTSIASRSWIATDAVSIHPELSAARVSDRIRSSSSSPLSRPLAP